MAIWYNSDISNETRYFLEFIAEKFQWSDVSSDIIMNVFCDNLKIEFCDLLIKLFRKVKKIITINKKSITINYIKLALGLPQIHYSQGDIENWLSESQMNYRRLKDVAPVSLYFGKFVYNDLITIHQSHWSTLKEWEGKISKFVSNQCLHQVKDYKTCFRNVFKLLKPGGEAAIFFCLKSGYVDWLYKLIGNPEWQKYFNGKSPEMPSTQFKYIPVSDYETMLQKIGFSVIECKIEERFIPFKKDDIISLALTYFQMPEASIEIFKRDAYNILMKYFPQNPLKPGTISIFLTVLLRKPEH
ncbi:methyltransf_25 domain-containing protein [Caerostris extrusa]|uniref:Methyltransf_25 domain-containing protein n=1 Tax=Caerostris extrusa TaxID=172846 RepID=A0AAV4U651_CAEEX|nr:methyltransf_25 domain-containing protein [Caerostris extrusa]